MNLANPCIPVRRNRTYARKRYVTDEEFHEFRAGATYPMQIAMDFALLIGQRQSDITQLRWDQIHIATPGDGWYAGEMIDGKFVQTCFGHIDIDQGKTGKRLAIAISASVYAVLARAWLLIEPQTASECLIQNKFRRRYTPDSFRALWQKYMRAWRAIHCGVSGWTFHDLRAKCVSDNKSLAAASLLAGHRNQTITGSVYDRNRRRAEPLR